jgi:hypothetical protein
METTTNSISESFGPDPRKDSQTTRDSEARDLEDGSPAITISLQAEDEGKELSEDPVIPVEALAGDWVTVSKAARLLEQSESTIRRKLKTGSLVGQLVFDSTIGSKRWMVDASEFPANSANSAALVPMEVIDRLEQAWDSTRETFARAERAERVAEFEKERRVEAEQERDRLRSLLAAENELAGRVARLEKQRRLEVEQERDRLLALLEAKPQPRSRWKRLRDRLGL